MKIMKKQSIYALMSAIALSGAIGFSSCSSSNDEVINNPDYNPKANTVKTQFAISLPESVSKTRQTASTVQESSTFRGMDNITLIPFSLTSGDVLNTSAANSALIDLPTFNAFYKDNSKSKVYADVELATGTSNFLFYGKAIDATPDVEISSAADKFQYGYLQVSGLIGTPTLSDVVFTPKAIYEDGTAEEQTAITAGKTVGTNLIAALNAVADATPSSALSGEQTPMFKEVTQTQNATVKGLFDTYKKLTTASSHSVQSIFFKLYRELDGLAASESTSDGYKLSTAIRTKIAEYCDITASGGATTAVTLKSSYTGYPASINLPDGAVRVTYSDANKSFGAATEMAYATSLNVTALDHYVYPANLQYFVNSPVKVSNSVKSPSYGTSTWTTIMADLYTDGTAVTGNTRSVALTNQVQYGVGRLDASVAALSGTYYDWNGEVVDITNGFTLTGILIGGQKPVGWDFTVKGSTAYTIYDKALNAGDTWTVKSGTASSANYTLVLETDKYEAEGEVGVVRVALEFKNNGNDFAGLNGEVIPKDGKFYVVGELKPASGTGYDAGTKGKDRVFTQDHKTIATFTINNGSDDSSNANYRKGLGTATNGLPDLRSSSMEIGLSVNLEWQEGLTFNVGI